MAFPAETVLEQGAQESPGHHLDGDLHLELAIGSLRQIYRPHPTAADQAQRLKRSESRQGIRCPRRHGGLPVSLQHAADLCPQLAVGCAAGIEKRFSLAALRIGQRLFKQCLQYRELTAEIHSCASLRKRLLTIVRSLLNRANAASNESCGMQPLMEPA